MREPDRNVIVRGEVWDVPHVNWEVTLVFDCLVMKWTCLFPFV